MVHFLLQDKRKISIFVQIFQMMRKLTVILLLSGMLLPCMATAQVTRIQPGQPGYTPPPLEREDKKMTVPNTLDDIDIKMDIYEKEFALDAFEKAVLRNSIVDFEEKRMAIMADEGLSYTEKIENVEPIKDQLMKEAGIFLTEKEIARFGELHMGTGELSKEVRKTKKERKRRRKNKQ